MRDISELLNNKKVLYKLKNSNGKSIEQMLREQADYLKSLIEKHMREYRANFTPKRYRRSGDLEKSVSVSAVQNKNGAPTIYVYFNHNAVHRSGYGAWKTDKYRSKFHDNQKFDRDDTVNTAILTNDGYVVTKSVWFAEYENFGWRGGNGFIDKAIMEFNRTNSMGIVITMKNIIQGRSKW